MGVEPTGDAAETPPNSFEDCDQHRLINTSRSEGSGMAPVKPGRSTRCFHVYAFMYGRKGETRADAFSLPFRTLSMSYSSAPRKLSSSKRGVFGPKVEAVPVLVVWTLHWKPCYTAGKSLCSLWKMRRSLSYDQTNTSTMCQRAQ